MKAATVTVTRNIGMNRGVARLWIEGKVLTQAGFHNGLRYTVIQGKNSLTLVLDKNGERKVAGMVDRPIIDMVGPRRLDCIGTTGDVAEINFAVDSGVITITKQ
jgi:hypothetical protein